MAVTTKMEAQESAENAAPSGAVTDANALVVEPVALRWELGEHGREPARDQTADSAVPTSARARRTRAQLLAAAQRVFEREGYLDATVAHIAAEAGTSHGSFYTYFRSKTDVFRGVMQGALDSVHDPGDVPSDDKSLSQIERIDLANRRFIEVYRQKTAMMALFEQVATMDEEIQALRLTVRGRAITRVEKSLLRLQRESKVRSDIDAHTAAGALVAMVNSLVYFWLVMGEEHDEEDVVQTLNKLWASAVGLAEDS